MRVLLVDVSGPFGQRLAELLGRQHTTLVFAGDPRDGRRPPAERPVFDAVVCALPELGPESRTRCLPRSCLARICTT